MTQVVHLDLEAASTVDLRQVGVDVWAHHPGTRLILVGYAIDDKPAKNFTWGGGLPWDVGHFDLMASTVRNAELHTAYDLARAIERGAEIHAWNANFERILYNAIMVPRGFPRVPPDHFHCTMAAAANAGLPMSLDDAALAAGAPHVKDKQGHANMLRMARPRGFEPNGDPRWWHVESQPKMDALRAYNLADVEAERDIHRRVPRMTKREREIWLIDQRMNDRGMPVDDNLIAQLEAITEEELRFLNKRLAHVTRHEVQSFTQSGRLLSWLTKHGYPLSDVSKGTLQEFMSSPEFYDLRGEVQEVLQLRREAAKTSTAKLKALRNFSQRDGRARHLVQYGGAVRTMRWAGRGPQIQNFPRPVIKHVEEAIKQIELGMPCEGIRAIFGNPLDVVSSCLRGVFKAPNGYSFVVCDFHSIEAIVLGWLAGFKDLLDVFRRGEDVYVYTAAGIGSTDRQLGKVLRLACGYCMGAAKFQQTAKSYGITLSGEESSNAVSRFRASNRPIVNLWYAYESAAKNAVSFPDQQFHVGPTRFRMGARDGRAKGALLIEKPSGGTLIYRDATIENGSIRYWGVHQTTRQWVQIDTYGGKICENCTQAVARDLLASAMREFDALHPNALLTTIHDEIVALAWNAGAIAPRMLNDLKRIMSDPPVWAPDMPLSAAGYIADRYAKS